MSDVRGHHQRWTGAATRQVQRRARSGLGLVNEFPSWPAAAGGRRHRLVGILEVKVELGAEFSTLGEAGLIPQDQPCKGTARSSQLVTCSLDALSSEVEKP